MDSLIISSIISGASFIAGVAAAIKLTGKREQRVDDRIEHLEKDAHSAPCEAIIEINRNIATIMTDISWIKRNGNGK